LALGSDNSERLTGEAAQVSDHKTLSAEQLKPGVLCTVLDVRRRKPRHEVFGDVALVQPSHGESAAGGLFIGWPLRVRHREPGTPFVVVDVLDREGRPHFPCSSALLDTRKVRFAPVSMEYVRQVLRLGYQTTL